MAANEVRTPYQKDVDKFPYLLPFRRLARITQVISDDQSGIPHNRMTHSMKVAQVGHRLAQYLLSKSENATGIERGGGLDPDVVHAAGLAHDIGHPPFGHTGEAVLDDIARSAGLDGFEGNAQTFRVLAKLTRHFAANSTSTTIGMNVSDRTLAASVKYPWPRSDDQQATRYRKWGYYPEDKKEFEERVAPLIHGDSKTLEAQVMDWADDITYAVHDIEDFYTSGAIPLHRLKQSMSTEDKSYDAVNPYDDEFAQFWQYASTRLRGSLPVSAEAAELLFRAQAARFPEVPFEEETAVARARVGRWVSDVITEAMEASSVEANGRLVVSSEMGAVIAVMKQLTWYYVIDRPEMALAQRGQARALREVVEAHVDMMMHATRTFDESNNIIDRDRRLAARRGLPASLLEIARGNALFSLAIPEKADDSQEQYLKEIDLHTAERLKVVTRSVIDYVSLQTESTVYDQFDLSQSGRG